MLCYLVAIAGILSSSTVRTVDVFPTGTLFGISLYDAAGVAADPAALGSEFFYLEVVLD